VACDSDGEISFQERKMKTLIAFVLLCSACCVARADQYVPGHYRSNGTYVQPYHRSSRDNSFNNNWSTRPNINPYTGRQGTLSPTWNDRAPARGQTFGGFGYSGSRYGR
jgi:hypothetical protein